MVFRQATSPGQIKDDVVLYTFPAAAIDNADTLGENNGDDAFAEDKQITGNFSTGLPRISSLLLQVFGIQETIVILMVETATLGTLVLQP